VSQHLGAGRDAQHFVQVQVGAALEHPRPGGAVAQRRLRRVAAHAQGREVRLACACTSFLAYEDKVQKHCQLVQISSVKF